MENATLSFLSEYSKRALQQAEKALFSPQDFNDVVQQSTSEDDDDDDDEEGLNIFFVRNICVYHTF